MTAERFPQISMLLKRDIITYKIKIERDQSFETYYIYFPAREATVSKVW